MSQVLQPPSCFRSLREFVTSDATKPPSPAGRMAFDTGSFRQFRQRVAPVNKHVPAPDLDPLQNVFFSHGRVMEMWPRCEAASISAIRETKPGIEQAQKILHWRSKPGLSTLQVKDTLVTKPSKQMQNKQQIHPHVPCQAIRLCSRHCLTGSWNLLSFSLANLLENRTFTTISAQPRDDPFLPPKTILMRHQGTLWANENLRVNNKGTRTHLSIARPFEGSRTTSSFGGC